MELKELIEAAWSDRDLLKQVTYADAVREVIEQVDQGKLRTAFPGTAGWEVNEWVKQAILL